MQRTHKMRHTLLKVTFERRGERRWPAKIYGFITITCAFGRPNNPQNYPARAHFASLRRSAKILSCARRSLARRVLRMRSVAMVEVAYDNEGGMGHTYSGNAEVIFDLFFSQSRWDSSCGLGNASHPPLGIIFCLPVKLENKEAIQSHVWVAILWLKQGIGEMVLRSCISIITLQGSSSRRKCENQFTTTKFQETRRVSQVYDVYNLRIKH